MSPENEAALLDFVQMVAGCTNCEGCRTAAKTALLFFEEEPEVKVDNAPQDML